MNELGVVLLIYFGSYVVDDVVALAFFDMGLLHYVLIVTYDWCIIPVDIAFITLYYHFLPDYLSPQCIPIPS